MNSKRPVTITATEFVANGYAGKIARGECVVKDELSPDGGNVADINEQFFGNYSIWYTDQNHDFIVQKDEQLTVEWLPPTDRDEAAAREFADGWRDAEIARLQGDKSKLREALRNIAATARSERGAIRRLHTIETLATEALSMFVDSEPDHK